MTDEVILRGKTRVRGSSPLIVTTDASVWLPAHVSAYVTSGGSWGIVGWNFTHLDPCASGNGHGKCSFATELRAMFFGIERIPYNTPLTILTDCQAAINVVEAWQRGKTEIPSWYKTKRRHAWTPNLVNLRDRVQKSGPLLTVKWVKGHAGHKYNTIADSLARLGREVLEDKLTAKQARHEARLLVKNALAIPDEKPNRHHNRSQPKGR